MNAPKRFTAALLILSLIAPPAFAKDYPVSVKQLPFSTKHGTQLHRNQYVGSDIRITHDGVLSVNSFFSNGRRFDGDHFVAHIQVFSRDGSLIGEIKQSKGLNATFGMRTREATEVGSVQLDKRKIGDISRVSVHHRYVDRVNDKALWNTLILAAANEYRKSDHNAHRPHFLPH